MYIVNFKKLTGRLQHQNSIDCLNLAFKKNGGLLINDPLLDNGLLKIRLFTL